MFHELSLNVSIIHNKMQNMNLINTIINDYYGSEAFLWKEVYQIPPFPPLKTNIFGSYFSVNVGTKHINFYPAFSPKSITGNTTYVNTIIKCDCILFVCYSVDFCTDYQFDKFIASMFLLFKKLNVRQLIVAIDSIPQTNNSGNQQSSRFSHIKNLLITYCEKINFTPSLIEYVPVSVSENKNILLHDYRSFEWFNGGSILEVLQKCKSIIKTENLNFRMLENLVRPHFYVLYGKLDKNKCELFTINEDKVSFIYSKEFEKQLYSKDNLTRDWRRVFIPKKDLKNLYLWHVLEVEIIILPHQKTTIKPNLTYIYKTLCGACVCVVTRIIKKFNLITGERLYDGCSELNTCEYGFVELKLRRPIFIELFDEYPLLGYMFLSIENENIIGLVRNRKSIDIDFKKNKESFELCTNPYSWSKSLEQIENPNIEHLNCSIASNNKKAFLILSEKIVRNPLNSFEALKIINNLPDLEKDQFLCIFLMKGQEETITQFLIRFLRDYLLLQINSYETIFNSIQQPLCFLSRKDFREHLHKSHNNLNLFVSSKLTYTLDGPNSQRPLLRQLLDSSDENTFLKYGEMFVKNPWETNEFLKLVYKLDNIRYLELILELCNVPEVFLVNKAIEVKAKNILKFFIQKDPYIYLKSTKRNKYVKFIEALDLSRHFEKFQQDFQSELNKQNFTSLLDTINWFALCVLYYDAKLNSDQEQTIKELIEKSNNYPEADQALDCLLNFLEANYKRNEYKFNRNQANSLMEKYSRIDVKVCQNQNCRNSLLRILNKSKSMDSVQICRTHKLVREFTIQDIKNLIDNRYIAIYVYFFYKLFVVGTVVINACNQKKIFFFNELQNFIEDIHLKQILLNDESFVKNLFLF